MSTFADSSALVKLYADEPGHQAIRALDTLVVSALARVEVPSALWRKTRTGELDDAAAATLVSAFELDFHGAPDSDPRFTIIALTEPLLITAAQETARHALRAYDAVQLASALAVHDIDPRCNQFACFDTELTRAASRTGFLILPQTE
ncbi:MAG: type II toxin-antitoxin system VapC family toxin [Solirubrobacteraceae bacterium]